MKKVIAGVIFLIFSTAGFLLTWSPGIVFSAVSGKSFSIVYSSDERGAITPCG